MSTTEKMIDSEILAHPSNGYELSSMPEGFGALYQAAYESGYASGWDAGHRRGFAEGFATAHKDAPNSAAVTLTFEGKPAPKNEPQDPDTQKLRVSGTPRRMLLGMPCPNCRVYLHIDERHCPTCKRPVGSVGR